MSVFSYYTNGRSTMLLPIVPWYIRASRTRYLVTKNSVDSFLLPRTESAAINISPLHVFR